MNDNTRNCMPRTNSTIVFDSIIKSVEHTTNSVQNICLTCIVAIFTKAYHTRRSQILCASFRCRYVNKLSNLLPQNGDGMTMTSLIT